MIETLAIVGTAHRLDPQPGWRRFGVPPGGAWDEESWQALQLLGVDEVWEAATTAFGGLTFWNFEMLEAGSLILLGLSGAARKNGRSYRLPCQLDVSQGDEIEVTAGPDGMRLLVGTSRRGGRDAQLVALPPTDEEVWFVPTGHAGEMGAVVSPQQDRIGIRLTGDFSPPPPLARSEPSVIGAIQIVRNGLLVHGPEGPTTGGYPKLGVVAGASLRTLAQSRPGERVQFVPITLDEALDKRAERKRLIEAWVGRVRLGLSVE